MAYAAGCMIIVWNSISDTKINLMRHENLVSALAFSPSRPSVLISLDEKGIICVWDFNFGNCIQMVAIPLAVSAMGGANAENDELAAPPSSFIKFSNKGNICFILECSEGDG